MRLKVHSIVYVLFLSISCCFSQQQVESVITDGLITTTFNVSEGQIMVYLPQYALNETITFTTQLHPKGKNNRIKSKNLDNLKSYQIHIGTHKFALTNKAFSIKNYNVSTGALSLLNEKGNLITKNQISTSPKLLSRRSSTCFPSYIVSGNTARIQTSSNGLASNKMLLLDKNEINPLVVTPSEIFFRVPNGVSGQKEIEFINNNDSIKAKVNVLQIDISAGKLNLSRLETTTLNIEVSGLEGLEEEVPLKIENKSPSNISLEGGNNQEIHIQPNGNIYQLSKTIQAVQGGSFSISANIAPPDILDSEESKPLCNCFVEDYSYLISPEACEKLGGNCYKISNSKVDTQYESTTYKLADFYINNYAQFVSLSIDDDIEDLEDDINDKWEDYDEAKKRKDENEAKYNDLVSIDKVLDSVPETYKDDLRRIIDSLTNLKKQLPENVVNSALKKAVEDAQSRVDACKERIENLKKEEIALKEKLKTQKEALIKIFEEYADVLQDDGCKTSYSFNENGEFKFKIDCSDAHLDDVLEEFRGELLNEVFKKKKLYKKTLKKLKDFPDKLKEAEKDCEDLSEALDKAKEAKATADLASAIELEAEDICKQIQRLLKRLYYWCKKNPDHCYFMEDIAELLNSCPKTQEELDEFWKNFDELLKKKKALEDGFAKAAKEAQEDMDKVDEDVSGLEDDINNLENAKRKREKRIRDAKAEKAAEVRAEAAAAAKRKAASNKKRKERKKADKKIKNLIKKAKSSEAGDDAFEDLLEGMGLSLLDDATGAGKLGTLIGGILVVKNMPDCACKMFKLLQKAISAQLRGEDLFRDVFTNEYLREWNSCANLPVFSSIMIGAKELSDAIGGMSKAQCRKAIEALDQAMRVQCK